MASSSLRTIRSSVISDNFYCPSADRGLRFDDPALGITWPEIGVSLTLSEKDRKHPTLDAIEPWEERGE